jgi:hypothetical protein
MCERGMRWESLRLQLSPSIGNTILLVILYGTTDLTRLGMTTETIFWYSVDRWQEGKSGRREEIIPNLILLITISLEGDTRDHPGRRQSSYHICRKAPQTSADPSDLLYP